VFVFITNVSNTVLTENSRREVIATVFLKIPRLPEFWQKFFFYFFLPNLHC
jgi:hypothetical protein